VAGSPNPAARNQAVDAITLLFDAVTVNWCVSKSIISENLDPMF